MNTKKGHSSEYSKENFRATLEGSANAVISIASVIVKLVYTFF